MDKKIDTVVDDIYEVLNNGPGEIDEQHLLDFGKRVAAVVSDSLTDREDRATLRMSNIGKPCNRALYYTVNNPEDKEPLPPEVRMKFLYGHLIEELVIFLAELAGHKIEGRQDEQEIAGIKGHRDLVLDGVVTDVKSASTYSFKKFESHNLAADDPFGYSDQLQSYLHTGQSDPCVTDKSRAAFLVIDKTLGHLCLDIHPYEPEDWEAAYEYKKDMVAKDEPPARGFDPVPEGKSGNMKLGMNCSYCDFKNKCHPGLKTYYYARGPVYLTEVKREPKVQQGEAQKEVSWVE